MDPQNPRSPLSTLWTPSTIAQDYLRTERITRPYADILIQRTGLADHLHAGPGKGDREVRLWDLACGTGAVVASLHDGFRNEVGEQNEEARPKMKVLAADVSPAMVEYVRERGAREGWNDAFSLVTDVVDATNIPSNLPYNPPTHLTLSFALMALPSSSLSTFHSLLPLGGTLGLTTWSSISWYRHLLSAAEQILPAHLYAATPSEERFMNLTFPSRHIDRHDSVKRALEEAGFEGVDVEVVEIEHGWPDVGEFVQAMELPIRAVSAGWGEGNEREMWGERVRSALVDGLEREFGDGRVRFGMGAVVAVGRKGV